MFLTRLFRGHRRADEGSTLIPTIGLVAIALLVTAVMGTSLISALGHSTAARASVQSQAAAESGIIQAKALIETANCTVNGVIVDSTSDPVFHATIWSQIGLATWTASCPREGTTTAVRIISTGYAQTNGLAGVSYGDSVTVESIYSYSAGGPVESGPGILSYSSTSLPDTTVSPISVARGDLVLPTGNFSCNSGTTIDGNVIVMAGTATVNGTCHISGSLWAKGIVNLGNGVTLGGDVKSGTATVVIGSTNHVLGSVEAAGAVTVDGIVDGNVVSATSVTTGVGSKIGGYVHSGKSGTTSTLKGTVGGEVTVSGSLSIYAGAKIGGRVTVLAISATYLKYFKATTLSGATAASTLLVDKVISTAVATTPTPQTPLVSFAYDAANWIHLAYNYADWKLVGFNTELIWPESGNCTVPTALGAGATAPDATWRTMQNATSPLVVNAMSCNQNFTGNFTLALRTDMAIYSNKYTLSDFILSSADGNPHKFWLMVPDGPAGSTSGPDCGGLVDHINVTGTAIVYSPITSLSYGPCTMKLPAGSQWRGQIYSGNLTGNGSPHSVVYSGLGIPGKDLGTGLPAVSRPILQLVSSRNRLNAGP